MLDREGVEVDEHSHLLILRDDVPKLVKTHGFTFRIYCEASRTEQHGHCSRNLSGSFGAWHEQRHGVQLPWNAPL